MGVPARSKRCEFCIRLDGVVEQVKARQEFFPRRHVDVAVRAFRDTETRFRGGDCGDANFTD